MTSPVDTSVKFFTSAMTNAPVLSGTAGALIGVLDACLVTGFDSKALTSLVALGGIMTATFTGTHSSQVDSVVLIAGVTGGPTGFAGANGEQKIVARPLSTTATWATALPDGTYTGTITMKMAPAGWTKVYSGTNKAAYKSSDPASTGMYLRVDDTGTTAARVVGYESMSDVDTGVGPFPTTVQMSGGGYWTKSLLANSTAIPWALVGDGRLFYLPMAPGVSSGGASQKASATRGFGDPAPFKPSGDAYSCVLNYSITSSPGSSHDGALDRASAPQTACPRTHTGFGGGVLNQCGSYVGGASANSGMDTTLGAFPSAQIDGALRLSKKYIFETGLGPRSELPGLFHIPQNGLAGTFDNFDSTPGSGALTGRKLLFMVSSNTTFPTTVSSSMGAVAFDVTGPWR